jgi:hypothetical protein
MLMTNSMEQSPWEADSSLAGQEILSFYGIRSFIAVLTIA